MVSTTAQEIAEGATSEQRKNTAREVTGSALTKHCTGHKFRLGQHGVIFWKELTQGITRMRFPDSLGKLRLKINASRIAQAWFKFERIRSRARPLSLSESTRTEGWRLGKNLL